MARPRKKGLEYFPMDTQWDDQARHFETLYKNDGVVWLVKFWQTAYQSETGHVDFDGIYGVIHPENCRITREKHLEMLKSAMDLKLVFKDINGFYTSNGVQKRLSEVYKDREKDRNRRKFELSDGKLSDNEGETGEKERENKKEKERKTKEVAPLPSPPGFITADIELLSAYDRWVKHRREIKKPLTPTQAETIFETAKDWGRDRFISAVAHSVSGGYQGLFEPHKPGPAFKQNNSVGPETALERYNARRIEELRKNNGGSING